MNSEVNWELVCLCELANLQLSSGQPENDPAPSCLNVIKLLQRSKQEERNARSFQVQFLTKPFQLTHIPKMEGTVSNHVITLLKLNFNLIDFFKNVFVKNANSSWPWHKKRT